MKNKIATTVEQSKKLLELGIDEGTADMYWWHYEKKTYLSGMYDGEFNKHEEDVPAWSLSALLEMLPLKINVGNDLCPLKIDKEYNNKNLKVDYGVCYLDKNSNGVGYFKENTLDAVFEMIVYLKENKLI